MHVSIPFCNRIFLISQYLGSFPDWIDEKDHPDIDERILIEHELKSINDDLVTFGSHSLSHLYMTELSEREAWKELTESKKTLKSILKQEVKMFAFPHGDYNNTLFSLAREANYNRVFTLSHAPAFSSTNEFVTGRVDVYMHESSLEFKLKLMGAYCWLSRLFDMKRCIVTFMSSLNSYLRQAE